MNGIKLLFVAFFLIEKAFAKVEQFLQFHIWGGHFPFDVPKNSTKKSFQLFRRFSRTLELTGFRITALAAQYLFPDSFVGLPQLNTVFYVRILPDVHAIGRKVGHRLDSGLLFPERCCRHSHGSVPIS